MAAGAWALVAIAAALAPASGPAAGAQAAAAEVQRSAERLAPPLSSARGDTGRPPRCPPRPKPGAKIACGGGVRDGGRTIVAFGDSKIMQYFPALDLVAQQRGWRLVAITRAGCPPMTVHFAYRCDRWRERARRLIDRIEPDVVVTSASITYEVVGGGRRLSMPASRPIVRRAYVRLLKRLKRDSKVAVMVNPPRSPQDPLACVRRNRNRLDRCAFERGKSPYWTYVARSARFAGVTSVDVNQIACRKGVCPLVIDDKLVLRDRTHMTATYVRTLAGWFDARLPR